VEYIGAYHRGLMAGRTPNLDNLATEGMIFTDYYAEASCTAGRANFITGELPIRIGTTTVGQAGAPTGIPAQAVTIAAVLKSMGYATGQFGKNHLGDRNEFLPTVHGFDEFYGYPYHLDAMEDPCRPNYPQDLRDQVGPRTMLHSWATSGDDATVDPRWGKVGKQKMEDAGEMRPESMETVDDEIRDKALTFIDKAHSDGKPFFVWLNPTRMHIVTHLSPKYEATRNSTNGWSEHEAGRAQFDDDVGLAMAKLKSLGVDAGNANIIADLKKGTSIGGTTYKVYIDGYDQTNMLTGKGPSNRHEIFYLGESTSSAVRIDDFEYRFIDQPNGWLGAKTTVDVPYLTNLRLDPFERTGWPQNGTKEGAQQYFDWFKYEFWRFVFAQQQVAKLAQAAIEFPPIQKGASFNLEAVKAQIEASRRSVGN
jgi:arylsulfatase A-like enzyme